MGGGSAGGARAARRPRGLYGAGCGPAARGRVADPSTAAGPHRDRQGGLRRAAHPRARRARGRVSSRQHRACAIGLRPEGHDPHTASWGHGHRTHPVGGRPMRRRRQSIVCLAAVCAVMTAPVWAAAQQGPALIREGIGAYNDFDPQRALPLLRRGVDPKAGPRDSLWALGVQYLAQILYEQGDEAGARAWIRWAVRFGPDLKLDTLNLLSQVIAEFRAARPATAPGPDDLRAGTEWVWPSTDPGSGPGRIEVRPEGAPA